MSDSHDSQKRPSPTIPPAPDGPGPHAGHGHANAAISVDGGIVVVGSHSNATTAASAPVSPAQATDPLTADSDRFAAWVVKLNSSGEVIWEQQYTARREAHGRAVAELPGGELVVVGEYREDERREYRGWILCIDSDGRELWRRVLGRPGITALYAVTVAPDGHIYAAGRQRGKGWLVGLVADGTSLWERALDQVDSVSALLRVPDGLVAAATIGASTTSLGTSELLGLDSSGQVRWRTAVPETGKGEIAALAGQDGGGLAVGRGHNAGSKKMSLWVLRWDRSGTVISSKFVGSPHIEIGRAVIALGDSGFAAAGDSLESFPDRRLRIWRLDRDGGVVWARSYGTSGQDLANGLAAGEAGGIVAVGQAAIPGSGKTSLLAVSAASDGSEKWQRILGRE